MACMRYFPGLLCVVKVRHGTFITHENTEKTKGMSTVHRHSLKKANQSHRMRPPQTPPERRRSSAPPPVRPARRRRKMRWLWPVILVLVVLAGLGFWYYSAQSAAKPSVSHATSTPTVQAQVQSTATVTNWKTVRTLNGTSTGDKTQKTETFTVSAPWQISWLCQGQHGVDDWLYIAIYYPDGTLYNAGAQVTCIAAKPVVGSIQEANAGTFYLTIDANTDWTVKIEDPQT